MDVIPYTQYHQSNSFGSFVARLHSMLSYGDKTPWNFYTVKADI